MIEFIEQGHKYVNSKGIIIPSVSDLVSFHFPNTYANVPQDVLEAKALYGTELHELLEKYDNGELTIDEVHYSNIDPNLKASLNQYIEMKKKYMIYPKSQERIIDYKERYAGRYDKLDEQNILWDVKSTAQKHIDKWSCQLGYYYLALGIEKEVGYVIWLPKNTKGEVILINPWSNKKCLDGLAIYEEYLARQ